MLLSPTHLFMYDLLCVIIFVSHWQYNDAYTKKVILVREFHAGLNKWELTKRNVVIDILWLLGHRALKFGDLR